MIKRFIKYRKFVAAAMVLLPLLFLFLHTERCSFTEPEENHVSHDYCEIVKNIIIEKVNISNINTLNLKTIIPFCYHCLEKQKSLVLFLINSDFKNYHYPKKTSKVYLYNNTFLI
jgi:hypothetical protein